MELHAKFQFILAFVFYTVHLCRGDHCKMLSQEDLYTCCPIHLRSVCCSFISICHTEQQFGLSTSPCPRCSTDVACKSGYFANQTGYAQACPDGFYCPYNFRCIIPCSLGAYCRKSYLSKADTIDGNSTNSEYSCKSVDDTLDSRALSFVNGMPICPGEGANTPCDIGSYCPNTTMKVVCPNTKQCYKGSVMPFRCNMLSSTCDFFTASELSHWISLILLVLELFLLCTAYVLFKMKRNIRLVNKNKSQCSNRIHVALKNVVNIDIRFSRQCELRENAAEIDLKFTNITVKLSNKRRLLTNVSGHFKSGYLTALMGPSGCGKTTLLKSLLGMEVSGKLTGEIYVNGDAVTDLRAMKHYIGYVGQTDVMHSTLTVKEILKYQAQLHLPHNYSKKYIRKLVKGMMNLLGVCSIANQIVGTDGINGISGGQRRRLSVGMALVKGPSVLFLDEPTSGLDSSASLSLVKLLRCLAEDFQMTVIAVIHQPRYELFALCHHLLLLGLSGKLVYAGDTMNVKSYFESLQYEFPIEKNVADVIIDITSGTQVSELCNIDSLPSNWKKYSSKMPENIDLECPVFARLQKHSLSFCSQFIVCFHREFLLQFRAFSGLIKELLIILAIGIIIGALQSSTNSKKTESEGSLISLAIGLIVSVSSLRQFSNKTIYKREFNSGLNRFSYYAAVLCFALPITILLYPVAFFSFLYALSNMVGSGYKHLLNIICAMFAVSGISYNISILTNENSSRLITVGFSLISSVFCGSFTSLCDMKSQSILLKIIYNLSYGRWYLEAYTEVELESYSDIFKADKLYRAYRNGYSLSNYWICLGVLFGFGLMSRITAFLLILLISRK